MRGTVRYKELVDGTYSSGHDGTFVSPCTVLGLRTEIKTTTILLWLGAPDWFRCRPDVETGHASVQSLGGVGRRRRRLTGVRGGIPVSMGDERMKRKEKVVVGEW